MPRLEILRLGKEPCATPTSVTVNGLIGLARLCPYLTTLRIHFQATSLLEAATSAATLSPSDDESLDRRKDCALVDLEVGEIRIPARSGLTAALILLRIFPRIHNIEYTNGEWSGAAKIIGDFRRIGVFVHRSGIVALPFECSTIASDT